MPPSLALASERGHFFCKNLDEPRLWMLIRAGLYVTNNNMKTTTICSVKNLFFSIYFIDYHCFMRLFLGGILGRLV